MNEINFEELTQYISNIKTHTKSTPQEIGVGFKKFGKILEQFNQLSDKEKAEFWIDAFRNPDNRDACEAFAGRHPDCSLNAFILKE